MSFLDKLRGWHSAIFAFLFSGMGLFVGLFLYLPINPTYNLFSNYISDIGAGPFEAKIIFGIGMILAAIFIILFFTYIADFLRKNSVENKIVQTYFITGLIAEIGLIIIALFPMDPLISYAFEIHRIAAIIFFGFTALNSLIFSCIQFKNSEFSMFLSVISLITAIFSAVFAIGFTIQEYILLDRVAFIVLSEWGFFGFVSIWLIAHALFFRKKK